MQMERLEMEPDADVRAEERIHDVVPRDAERVEAEPDDEQMPGVPRRVSHRAQHLDVRDPVERLRVPAGDSRPRRDELLEPRELRDAEGRVEIRHVVLEAERYDLVPRIRAL